MEWIGVADNLVLVSDKTISVIFPIRNTNGILSREPTVQLMVHEIVCTSKLFPSLYNE
jgi:hypothetical protein